MKLARLVVIVVTVGVCLVIMHAAHGHLALRGPGARPTVHHVVVRAAAPLPAAPCMSCTPYKPGRHGRGRMHFRMPRLFRHRVFWRPFRWARRGRRGRARRHPLWWLGF